MYVYALPNTNTEYENKPRLCVSVVFCIRCMLKFRKAVFETQDLIFNNVQYYLTKFVIFEICGPIYEYKFHIPVYFEGV